MLPPVYIKRPSVPIKPSEYIQTQETITIQNYENFEICNIPKNATSFCIYANKDYDNCIESYDITFYLEEQKNLNYEIEQKQYENDMIIFNEEVKKYNAYTKNLAVYNEYIEKKKKEELYKKLKKELGK